MLEIAIGRSNLILAAVTVPIQSTCQYSDVETEPEAYVPPGLAAKAVTVAVGPVTVVIVNG